MEESNIDVINKTVLSVNNLMLGPFKDFNIEIPLNSFTIITGSNKSGKSLLLKVMALVVNTKKVTYNKEIIANDKDIAYFYDISFKFNTVLETIRYPLECLGLDEVKITKLVRDVSKDFKITKLLKSKIEDLSNYEKVKVQLASLVVNSPKLLLLDDPGLYLSSLEKEDFMGILEQLRTTGITIVLSSSSLDEVIYTINSTVYVLDNGSIVSSGSMLDVLSNDSLLNKVGLELPFMVDLSVKLEYYNLVNKITLSPLGLVESLWK